MDAPALSLRICIDVPELDAAIAFYEAAVGLRVARRLGPHWAELLGAGCPVDLVQAEPGSPWSPRSSAVRGFERHWTPVHLDLVVDDLDAAVARATAAGAVLEREVLTRRWGRMANLADPFGHGLCLLQFVGRGYDELLDPAGG